jgi:chloramphenicol O-acetyltransferase type B
VILAHNREGSRDFSKVLKTKIGNDVFIGANAVVLPGTIVGDGAIIGACSLVNKNVEPYSIVGGVPAKVVGRVHRDKKNRRKYVRMEDRYY